VIRAGAPFGSQVKYGVVGNFPAPLPLVGNLLKIGLCWTSPIRVRM
jgi:hypothetical protein